MQVRGGPVTPWPFRWDRTADPPAPDAALPGARKQALPVASAKRVENLLPVPAGDATQQALPQTRQGAESGWSGESRLLPTRFPLLPAFITAIQGLVSRRQFDAPSLCEDRHPDINRRRLQSLKRSQGGAVRP